MMEEQVIFNLIQKYLDGALSEHEMATVRKRIESEPALAGELQNQQLERQVMDELVARKLKEKMRQWDQQLPVYKPSFFKKRQNLLPFLLTIVVIAACAVFFILKKITPSPAPSGQPQKTEQIPPVANHGEGPQESKALDANPKNPAGNPELQKTETRKQIAYLEIAQRHYETLPSLTFPFRGNGEAADSISRAMEAADQAYRRGDLSEATNITAALAATYPNVSRLQLILGKLYFEKKDFESAIGSLSAVSKTPTLFASEAQWNLLLAYLARYDKEKQFYKKLLREILSDPNHFGYKKALLLQEESADWK